MKALIRFAILFSMLVAAFLVYRLSEEHYFVFNDKHYSIALKNKKDQELGYGVRFKAGIEVWKFWRAGYGGIAEEKIFPGRPNSGAKKKGVIR
ncbi:MAG: hypothetical protein ABIJ27_01210 [Candidatus Omnitrophota bacterium]